MYGLLNPNFYCGLMGGVIIGYVTLFMKNWLYNNVLHHFNFIIKCISAYENISTVLKDEFF